MPFDASAAIADLAISACGKGKNELDQQVSSLASVIKIYNEKKIASANICVYLKINCLCLIECNIKRP